MGKNTKKKKQNAGANSPGDQSALLPAGVEKKQAAESEEMMGMLEHDAVAEAASAVEEVTEEQTRGNRRMEGVVWSGAAKHENLDDRPSPSHAGAAPTPELPAVTQYSPPDATTNENSGDQSAVRPTSPRPAGVETKSFLLLLEESEETRGMLKKDEVEAAASAAEEAFPSEETTGMLKKDEVEAAASAAEEAFPSEETRGMLKKDEVEAAASAAEEAFPSHGRELSQVGEEDKEEETHGIRRMEGVQEVVCVSVRDLRMIHISASLVCILQNMCVVFKICALQNIDKCIPVLIQQRHEYSRRKRTCKHTRTHAHSKMLRNRVQGNRRAYRMVDPTGQSKRWRAVTFHPRSH